jgi:hypothetical protein
MWLDHAISFSVAESTYSLSIENFSSGNYGIVRKEYLPLPVAGGAIFFLSTFLQHQPRLNLPSLPINRN